MRIFMEGRRKVVTSFDPVIVDGVATNRRVLSKTSQDKKDSTDMKRIIDRAKKGKIPLDLLLSQNKRKGVFADFTNAPDYVEAKNRVIRVEQAFMTLDPKIRKEFDNDPAKYVAFVLDPKNEAKAIEMGILPPHKMEYKRELGAEGAEFWVTYKNGVEVDRKPVAVSPAAQPAGTGV